MKLTAICLAFLACGTLTQNAAAQEPELEQQALQLCRGMPTCRRAVKLQVFPAHMLIACATAFDTGEGNGPTKTNAQRMCDMVFGDIIKKSQTAAR